MTKDEEKVYINKLEEKIYYAKSTDSEEKITEQLKLFFEELVKRKRKDAIEGGLQASLIIFPKVFAAKINEKDGTATHASSSINLVKFINHDPKYLTDTGIRKFSIYKKEEKQKIENATEARILDGENELMIAIWSDKKSESSFELKMIKRIIAICDRLMKDKHYENIDIGIHTSNIKIDFGEWTVAKGKMMLEEIEKKKGK